MPLDRYQIEEFPNHWTDTYASVDGSIGYVVGRGEEEESAFCRLFTRKPAPGVSLKALEVVEIYTEMSSVKALPFRSGYFNSFKEMPNSIKGPRVNGFWGSSYPTQNHKRGLNHRNFHVVDAGGGTSVIGEENYFSGTSVANFYFGNYDYLDRETQEKYLFHKDGNITSYAFSPNVAIVRDEKTNVLKVNVRGNTVGFFSKGSIILGKGCHHYREVITEETHLRVA